MNFRNLVFEGGGVKGIAYSGALKVLQTMGILEKIKRVAGTSAGAITAVLLALGYSVENISGIIKQLNFKRFADDDPGILLDLWRLYSEYGWHKGDAFSVWIKKAIGHKTGNPRLSFEEHHRNVLEDNTLKELFVVGTNLSNQSSQIFSFETTPDMPICDAVRISMSIPLYFRAVKRNKDLFVDGGVTLNYPVHIFDNVKYLDLVANGETVTYSNKPGYVFNHETLGFRLDSKNKIKYSEKNWANMPTEINSLFDYIFALVGFMQEEANKRHLHNNDWNRTIFIDTLGVKATDFDLSMNDVSSLIQSGINGVQKYFNWRNSTDIARPK